MRRGQRQARNRSAGAVVRIACTKPPPTSPGRKYRKFARRSAQDYKSGNRAVPRLVRPAKNAKAVTGGGNNEGGQTFAATGGLVRAKTIQKPSGWRTLHIQFSLRKSPIHRHLVLARVYRSDVRSGICFR